jgi:hypothetical protein
VRGPNYQDPDAQVDGEGMDPRSPFATNMRSAPWLQAMPPWHMWGNTERLTVPVETTEAPRAGSVQQLIKISYKRPETWHWLFKARLVSGPDNTAAFFTRIFVRWNLIAGIGRSTILMVGEFRPPPAPNIDLRPFERYIFQWGPVDTAFPRDATIYTTQANSPPREFQGDGPFPDTGPAIAQIVAQDIQLSANIVALTHEDNVAAVGQPVTVELSAQFSPKTHVRPDWMQLDAPVEAQFAGAETGGT